MENSSKYLRVVKIALILIGLIAIAKWAFPPIYRLLDESAKITYETEERYSILENAYSDGLKFGYEAARHYKNTDKGELEDIALQLYKKKEPTNISVGPGENDIWDFPDDEYFKELATLKSYRGKKDTNNLIEAFKSGYTDGFIEYFKD